MNGDEIGIQRFGRAVIRQIRIRIDYEIDPGSFGVQPSDLRRQVAEDFAERQAGIGNVIQVHMVEFPGDFAAAGSGIDQAADSVGIEGNGGG